MRTLKHSYMVPPLGWIGYAPHTTFVVSGLDFEDYVLKCRDHCLTNGKPVGLLFQEECLDSICQYHLDKGSGGFFRDKTQQPVKPREPGKLNGQIIKVGTMTLADWWLKSGGVAVDQQESSARAKVCATCRENVLPKDCVGCIGRWVRALIERLASKHTTPFDDKINACDVCGCGLKVKVHVPLEVIHRHMPPEWNDRFPDWCWCKKHDPQP